MKLYSTLTKKIENFVPLHDKKVNLFVCGPTVYDFSHLGHAKTYTQMDTLARVLRLDGYEVDYLQNITDLDDKIITRAAEQGISWENLRTQFEAEYHTDMDALQNNSVTRYARATDHIDDIIKQVQTLLDRKHAYVIEDGVYFEIATFPGYGKLSGRREVKENDAETRIDQSDQKRGWNDFCLWKFSKPGEPVWDAPFGQGRPGWHIEDTAITEHFFGPQYDIHGGAVDLIFPHHEAEIAQMEAASGKVPLVGYWTHTGFLNIEGAKMSKSLHNFFTIRDVIEKGYDPLAVRLLMLQSHYRSAINFTWENLDGAVNRLQTFREFADLQFQNQVSAITPHKSYFFEQQRSILKLLAEDLGTPQALAQLNAVIDTLQAHGLANEQRDQFKDFLAFLDKAFGLNLAVRTDLTHEQKLLLKQRLKVRAAKDWTQSDAIRLQLNDQGIGVRDSENQQVWYRV